MVAGSPVMSQLASVPWALLALLTVARFANAAFERPGASWHSGVELAGVQGPAWHLAHERLYNMPDLDRHHLGLAAPLGPVVLGLGVDLMGPERHRELALRLGVGADVGQGRLRLGGGVHVLQLKQSNAPLVRRLAPSFGAQIPIFRQWRLAAWMRGAASGLASPLLNLQVTRLVQGEGDLNVALCRGRHPWRLRLRARRHLSPRLDLELGTVSAPRQFRLGAGARVRSCWVRYRVDTHAYLGASHLFSLCCGGR